MKILFRKITPLKECCFVDIFYTKYKIKFNKYIHPYLGVMNVVKFFSGKASNSLLYTDMRCTWVRF